MNPRSRLYGHFPALHDRYHETFRLDADFTAGSVGVERSLTQFQAPKNPHKGR